VKVSQLIRMLADYIQDHGDTLVFLGADNDPVKVWPTGITVHRAKDSNHNSMAVIRKEAFHQPRRRKPTGHVEHIDGDLLNNEISNLRIVTDRENL
jgi:hypothetical protein